MKALPLAARVYVGCVIAAAVVILAVILPQTTFEQPLLFLALLLVSSFTSAFKVSLPLAKSGSTMSVSYAVDFASLLLLGPNPTMIVAIASAWSQCTFRMKEKNPLYRTLFSMACLCITVQAAGLAYLWLGGVPGHLGQELQSIAKPPRGAPPTYF